MRAFDLDWGRAFYLRRADDVLEICAASFVDRERLSDVHILTPNHFRLIRSGQVVTLGDLHIVTGPIGFHVNARGKPCGHGLVKDLAEAIAAEMEDVPGFELGAA